MFFVALGVCLPVWLAYISYTEKNKVKWDSRYYALIFLLINYIFGAFVFKLPELILGEHSKACCLA
jgi:hypothetical protein